MPAAKKATVTSTRKPRRVANRRQPSTTVSKKVDTEDKTEAADTTTKHVSTAGVQKNEGKPRGTVAKRRKKLKDALIKRVDARDADEALAEQIELLGGSTVSPMRRR